MESFIATRIYQRVYDEVELSDKKDMILSLKYSKLEHQTIVKMYENTTITLQ